MAIYVVRSKMAVLLLLAATIVSLSACEQTASTSAAVQAISADNKTKPFASPTSAGPSFEYGRVRNLVGASPEQIADFARQYAAARLTADKTEPQVLLSRFVENNELPNLGLPCLPWPTIEEPPLALVVLKADFGESSRAVSGGYDHSSYKVVVFDLWAAEATYIESSTNGSSFTKLLNDPSLPEDVPEQDQTLAAQPPSSCSTSTTPKQYHYGDTVSGDPAPATVPGQPYPTRTSEPPLPGAKPTVNW